MHLLNITNFDYGMMTALFLIILVISYKFRRTNSTSEVFLLMKNYQMPAFVRPLSFLSFGLTEFVALSGYGAYAGIPALCAFIPVFLVSAWIYEVFIAKSEVFQSLIQVKDTNLSNKFILVIYGLFMIIVAGVSIAIMVTMFKSLLGWEFGNSTLSLLGVMLVALLLGGMIAATYNQAISWIIVTLVMLVVATLAYRAIGSGNIIFNLQQVAKDNQLPLESFTKFKYNLHTIKDLWVLVLASMMIFIMSPLNFLKMPVSSSATISSRYFTRIIQLASILVLIFLGIFALATPYKANLIAGKRVVTQQMRLNDGSIGYIVKAVPTDQPTLQRGLVPSLAEDDNNITSMSLVQFDFVSSAMVLLKSVLPYAFVSLFILVMLFYKAISESILFATMIIIRRFYAPKYNKTGDELENLWASRVFLFALIAVSISVGLVFFKYFDIYYMLSIILLLSTPLLLNLIGLSVNWLVDCIIYGVIFILLLINNIEGVPSLFPLVHFKDLFSMVCSLSSMVAIIYILSYGLVKIVGKKD